MAKDQNERAKESRKRRRHDGLKRREYWATDDEHKAIAERLRELRDGIQRVFEKED